MTLPDLAALNKYWRHNPPVHIAVARYLGIKPPGTAARQPANSDLIAQASALAGGPPRAKFVPPIPIH